MSTSTTSAGQDASGASTFDPNNLNLTALLASDSADDYIRDITCILQAGGNEYSGGLGSRISAIFVILVVSSALTVFPLLATRVRRLRIPLYAYLFARYFGAGVIVATAFIHLLDPAYSEIGPQTCVGLTGGWASYSWPPAIALASSIAVFLMDFYAELYVERKYGLKHGTSESQDRQAMQSGNVDAALAVYQDMDGGPRHRSTHQHLHSADQDQQPQPNDVTSPKKLEEAGAMSTAVSDISDREKEELLDRSFKQQIAAFLILEFGVLFHSVIIGLTLGSAGDEFSTLYPVIVFHQSFEGLGIGARLSAIPMPTRYSWLPWWLCAGYGLTTPIAIAAGLGVRTTYDAGSFTANIVSGVLDSISAGILLYTGFVELLARDFLFNPDRTDDLKQLTFMIFSVLLGAALMALLGKWA